MNVFAALHSIDDGANHDDEINENAAHAHETLRGGMQGAGDEFSHTVLLEKSGRPFRRDLPESMFILTQARQKVKEGGLRNTLSCRKNPFRTAEDNR